MRSVIGSVGKMRLSLGSASYCGYRLYLTLAFSATYLPFYFKRLLGLSLSFYFFVLTLFLLHLRHKAKYKPSLLSGSGCYFHFKVHKVEQLD